MSNLIHFQDEFFLFPLQEEKIRSKSIKKNIFLIEVRSCPELTKLVYCEIESSKLYFKCVINKMLKLYDVIMAN